MRVLILGAGPAALFAATAVATAGGEVMIAGIRRKSEMFGAQYLHAPIPNLECGPRATIKYELRGTPQQYRTKVYGPSFGGSVSPEDLAEEHDGWDIRLAYGHAWSVFGGIVQNYFFEDSFAIGGVVDKLKPDITLSSLPASLLCRDPEHTFQAQEIWSIGDAPERGVFCPVQVPDDTVVCDGTRDVSWYRAAKVFGYATAEWKRKPPLEGVARVLKPLKHNCTCLSHIKRIGRYGKWQKGVLSHTAYNDAMEAIQLWQISSGR